MIVGIGIDVIEIKRVNERLGNRIFSLKEFEIWQKRKSIEFIAGRFALKEAFFKAIGTGIRDVDFKSISFVPDENGALYLEENESVISLENKYGFDFVHASLSHDGGIAAAVVLLEKRM
ncbi:MAG: holo-[acyl-carrier-protein] synthase [Mesoaciditoga sp.]|uniref:holo-ACP synthase n=1 Tax=Athalassotoga sp. TaxID=2022597 RepID=UPI000CB21BEE|nr:MAG: holo-[acyl-carrier-protein] synthase [Mesoaciditoga sp.]HEU23745.1 holo-[acyl-carrier-protein] synthase [Mesoaciditoga lauensis]